MFLNFVLEIMKSLTLFQGAYSNNLFKEPMSKEEEEECIRKCAEKDMEARNKLIEHNLRLVAHIVKKFETNKSDIDDLIGIGTVGLIKGIDTYKPNHNVKITTYCAKCIENAHLTLRNILQYFKQHLMLCKVKFKQNTRFNLQTLVEHYQK